MTNVWIFGTFIVNNAGEAMQQYETICEQAAGYPSVRGFLHRATSGSDGLVLTHGAGGNCNSPLLAAMAQNLSQNGISVLRCELPFRQQRPYGPPLRTAEVDQQGLRRAVEVLRTIVSGRVFLGGQSYGGRMATMLAAQEHSVTDGLLLLSYPLHPPNKPQQLRTGHFPQIRTRCLFVHGSQDPFATCEEIQSALKLIPVQTMLLSIEGTGHELVSKKNSDVGRLDGATLAERITSKVFEIWNR
ncbi:MAG TPA: alpha/beta family hydrolase [Terriglobales bacterium]|nr:alpha/beta family hydrolase [Terriglobales bacterium]